MKIKKLIPIIMLSAILSGCNQSSDVRSKAFIKEIGVDCTDVQSVTLRVFGSDETISGSGKTLLSAVENCESSQSKNFFSGHLEVIASSPLNMGNNLLTLLQNNRISPSCYVLCLPENAAGFIQNKGGTLAELIKSNGRNGIILPQTISDVINDLLENDQKAAVPTQKDGKLTMAVISPHKLIGTLSEEESKGLCWLHGNVSDVYLPIECDDVKTDFYIRKSCTKIKAKQNGEKIDISIEIKINGNSEENSQNIKAEKEQTGKYVSSLCSKTIAKTVVGMKADLFGIEKAINSANISHGKTWEELIPLLNFSYEIKISQ